MRNGIAAPAAAGAASASGAWMPDGVVSAIVPLPGRNGIARPSQVSAVASWIGDNAGSDHLPVLAELVRVDG